MRTLIVTSQVTFVPENYGRCIVALANHPEVMGLLLIQNRKPSLLLKELLYLSSGLAPRLGATLARNGLVRRSKDPRRLAFSRLNKPVFELATVAGHEILALCDRERIDVIVNARTRCIYPPALLNRPPLGCFNLHHGLLPQQRGVMNDLWALSQSRPAGFSIHKMTERIDAGGIVMREQVSDGKERNYAAYLLRSSEREAEALGRFLSELAANGTVVLQPNLKDNQTRFFRTPGLFTLFKMRVAGMKL